MSSIAPTRFDPPYLLFIGDVVSRSFAKTALGLVQWRRERIAGQLRFDGNPLDIGAPDMTLEQAAQAGVRSLVIGVNPVGGAISDSWARTLSDAAAMGMDIVSGLHTRLETIPGLADAARGSGAKLVNVRVPPANIPIATGAPRSGRRILMVGTDCAVGKKYTALALAQCMERRGLKATFRATGQTGVMIAGSGMPIDAVVSDFVAGAAEILSPANDADHWDVIEGQGSLFHPSYAGVSLGLLHGSQPDAIILCHDASRTRIETVSHARMPTLAECIYLNLRCARIVNAGVVCAGVSLNTSGLEPSEREAAKQGARAETGLACVDPIADGCDALVDALVEKFPEGQGCVR